MNVKEEVLSSKELNVTELIKIQNHNGKKAVSARELHAFLEVKSNFAEWISRRIKEYSFIENQDFVSLFENSKKPKGGRPTIDYALTLEMAKELSMVEKNEKGRQARLYFIECEKRVMENYNKFYIPQTYPEALKLAYEQSLVIEEQEQQIKALSPKAEYFDDLVDRTLNLNVRDTAKELGFGQKAFIEKLITMKYVYRDSSNNIKPYQKHVDNGIFVLKEFANKNNGKTGNQTLITTNGRKVFNALLNKKALR